VSKKQKQMEFISHDMFGVKIFDHTSSQKRLVHIAINPQGIHCSHCESNDCLHIEYLLEHPDLQKLLTQKRKQGWNIPDV
jgi:hypothetical protein